MRHVGLCVLFSLAASAAMAQNLVVNGDFNGLGGWTATGQAEVHNAGDFGMPGSPTPGAPFAGAITSWGGNWTAPQGSITQTVQMTGNGTLNCDLYAAARAADSWRNVAINVIWNGQVVATVARSADASKWAADFAWQSFTNIPITGVGANTLKVEWLIHFAEWSWLGVDNMSVFPASCDNPTTITDVTPNLFAVPPAPGVKELTITGTHLDLVTGAQLKNGATTIGGTITSQSAAQLKATFDLPLTPLGAYDLLLSRPASGVCQPIITRGSAITLACSTQNAYMREVHGDRGLSGSSAHVVRLVGDNIGPLLTGVTLTKTHNSQAQIPATSLSVIDASTVDATFDLRNAEGGRYDVVYTWNAQTCATGAPAQHSKAFLVYMPAITNGSFEEGWTADATTGGYCDPPGPAGNANGNANRPFARHWDEYLWSLTGHQGAFKRDVAVDGPDCLDGKPKNVKGQHFAGFDSNAYDPANGTISFFQTIDAGPLLDANGALKEPFNVRARFDISNANATGYLRLIGDTEVAGDANALTLLAETTIPFTTENGFISDPAYNAVIPKGTIWPTSNPAILTIEFRFFLATVPTLWGCSVDDVRTGPYIPPGCEGRTIWADNNLDGSVDMVDFAEIQACLTTGMAEPPAALPEACACLDRDFNGQIGEPDVVEFIKCVTGPATPWSREAVPTCVP